MKNPIRVPLRSLNRKKEKEQEQRIKPCPSSATLGSASSLSQTASYYSCTSSLASSAQTRQSVEPPGWVHNPPPRTLNEEDATNRLFKENYEPMPMRNSCQHPPPSNAILRQLDQQGGVRPPVFVRPLQPAQSQNVPPYQRQNMTHMLSDKTIHMNYSDSSGDTLEPILGLKKESLSVEEFKCTEEMVQQMNKKMKSKNWTINFELCDDGDGRHVPSTVSSKSVDIENQVSYLQTHLTEQCDNITTNTSELYNEMSVHSKQEDEDSYFPDDLFSPPAAAKSGKNSPFSSPPHTPCLAAGDTGNNTSCYPEEEDEGNHAASTVLLDMERVNDIYASMMAEFRKKILSELREEMQKETQHQLSALKLELNEMNNRLASIEKKQTSAQSLQEESQRYSSTLETSILEKVTSQVIGDKAKQQQQLEDMLDTKLAMAMAGASVELKLAVHEVKKEGERLSNLAVCAKPPPASNKFKKPRKNSWNCTSSDEEECGSKLINESFAEAMQSIDEFVDDCDNLANEFDTIALRMRQGGESDDEYL